MVVRRDVVESATWAVDPADRVAHGDADIIRVVDHEVFHMHFVRGGLRHGKTNRGRQSHSQTDWT